MKGSIADSVIWLGEKGLYDGGLSVPSPLCSCQRQMNQALIENIQTLKNMLVTRATGGTVVFDDYEDLRYRLIDDVSLRDRLPQFVRTCRTLAEFWAFIKAKYGTYAERRKFIREEFDAVLTYLEQQDRTPSDSSVEGILEKVDLPHVADAWQKARQRRATDPSGAITSARTLLETVCKHILDAEASQYGDTDDLPKLYRKTAEVLNLAPEQHSEQVFKQILGSCQSVVEGLGALRNRHSDAHGKGIAAVRPAARHAELAVNLAGTMATFLLATWEWKKPHSNSPNSNEAGN